MTYDEYLAHHGILGMRWGKRNGPPYPLLRKNMSTAERKENPPKKDDGGESEKKVVPSKPVKVETTGGERTVPNSKSVKDMSDKELNDSINRLKKEKEYRDLTTNDVTKGAAFVKALLLGAGALGITTFVSTYVKGVSESGGKKFTAETSKRMGPKIEELFVKLDTMKKK